MKFLEENIGENPSNLGVGKCFLSKTFKSTNYKRKNDKLDFIKT